MYSDIYNEFFALELGASHFNKLSNLTGNTVNYRLRNLAIKYGRNATLGFILYAIKEWKKPFVDGHKGTFYNQAKDVQLINAFRQYYADNQPKKSLIPNVEMLGQYIDNKIALIPIGTYNKNGFENIYQLKEDGKVVEITTMDRLQSYIKDGIKRFIFHPAQAGLVCIDIDAHEGKGNGFLNLYNWMHDNCVEREYFDTLVWCDTPSGKHLYYRCDKIQSDEYKDEITDDVEIRAGKKTLTAGGSVKNGCDLYELHGEVSKAPYQDMRLDYYFTKPKKQVYKPREVKTDVDVDKIVARFEARHYHETPHWYIIKLAYCLKNCGVDKSTCELYCFNSYAHNSRNRPDDTQKEIDDTYKD